MIVQQVNLLQEMINILNTKLENLIIVSNSVIEQTQFPKIFPYKFQDSKQILTQQPQTKYSVKTNMLPISTPANKSAVKLYFHSPPKNCQNASIYQTQSSFQKQKSTSFNITPSPTHVYEKNHQLFHHFNERERSSTPKFHPNSPAQSKNKPAHVKQMKGSEEFSQKLSDSKHSEFSIVRKQLEKRKSENQTHVKIEDVKNKIQNFESLRSTITTSYSNMELPGISRKINFSGNEAPISEFTRERIFTMQQNSDNLKHKHLLQPSQVNNLGGSKSHQSLDKSDNMKKINFHKQAKKISYHNFLEKKNNNSSVNSNELKQNIRQNLKTTNNTGTDMKKQSKFPSFLSSRFEKKEQKNDQKLKSKQFPKIFPSNLNCQQKKEQVKPLQSKALSTNKHAKSFSVFETIGLTSKRNSNNIDFCLTSDSFYPQPLTPKGTKIARQKSISFHDSRIKFFEPFQLDSSRMNNLKLGNKAKIVSASLRQSIDNKHKENQKSFTKGIYPQYTKRQNCDEIKERKIEKFSVEKPFYLHLNKTLSNSKIVEDQFLNEKQNTPNKQGIMKSKPKNLSSIDDIKQTLINCNLFSQEDYKGVFESHKKDILKSSNNTKKETVKFQILPERRTSLRDLIDSSDVQSHHDSEEERKLVELAEMCEQKRSKWILDQTDTIKESLKELSEFNTEKSLYDNEWKKISIKDFSTARNNNRRNSTICEHIDEIREEETSDLKQSSKVSSIRLISENQIDDKYKGIKHEVRFMKGKQRSLNIEISDGQDAENDQQSFERLSLDDFDIRWCSEEPLVGNEISQEVKQTFITYGARHKQTNLLYTIKKFEKNTFRQLGDSFISSFIRKIKIQMLSINHPNVEKIYAIFNDKNTIYLVCQFTETRLSDILCEKVKEKLLDSSQMCISSPNVIANENNKAMLFQQVINGLEEIHLNLITHKGIQPNNIRIVFDTCKISGFSDAEFVDQPVSNFCNSYICPQNLFDSSKLAMDIWCLGILAFELLVGKRPFNEQKDNTSKKVRKILQCNFDIPVEKAPLCEELLNSALKRNPKDRASIFQIKNIWTRKLREFVKDERKGEEICNELVKILNE